jgi:hypothetical protein
LQAIIQLFAATIFWISTLTGLPGVIRGLYDEDGSVAIIDVFYWTPQGTSTKGDCEITLKTRTVVGGSGFIISSLILMLEVQERWYIPKLNDIGWWGELIHKPSSLTLEPISHALHPLCNS